MLEMPKLIRDWKRVRTPDFWNLIFRPAANDQDRLEEKTGRSGRNNTRARGVQEQAAGSNRLHTYMYSLYQHMHTSIHAHGPLCRHPVTCAGHHRRFSRFFDSISASWTRW